MAKPKRRKTIIYWTNETNDKKKRNGEEEIRKFICSFTNKKQVRYCIFQNKFLCILNVIDLDQTIMIQVFVLLCFNNEGWTLKKYLFDHGSRDCHVVVFSLFFFSTALVCVFGVLGRFVLNADEMWSKILCSFLLFCLICIWLTPKQCNWKR